MTLKTERGGGRTRGGLPAPTRITTQIAAPLLAVLALVGCDDGSPKFDGKSAAGWATALQDASETDRSMLFMRLVNGRGKAVGVMTGMLGLGDAQAATFGAQALYGVQPIVGDVGPVAVALREARSKYPEEEELGEAVVLALGGMASRSAVALEGVAAELDATSDRVSGAAFKVVRELGERASPLRSRLLTLRDDERTRLQASVCLAFTGSVEPDVRAQLHAAFADAGTSYADRILAGRALVRVGATAPVASVLGMLDDEHAHLRRLAIDVLGGIADPPDEVSAAWRRALEDEHAMVRAAAARALARSGAGSDQALVSILRGLLTDRHALAQIAAAEGLLLTGGKDDSAARGVLISRATSGVADSVAVHAIRRVGLGTKEAKAALEKAAGASVLEVRMAAERALDALDFQD